MFKKIDKYINSVFSAPYVKKLQEQRDFLQAMKDRNLSIDSGLIILDKLLAEERGVKCDILV